MGRSKGNRGQKLQNAIQRSEARTKSKQDLARQEAEQIDTIMASDGVSRTLAIQKPEITWREHLEIKDAKKETSLPVKQVGHLDEEFSLENLVNEGALDEEFDSLMSGLTMSTGIFTDAVVDSAISRFVGVS